MIRGDGFQRLQPGSLPSILRSFKAAVTRESRRRNFAQAGFWQRSFHDRIIRDDLEYYFIEQYINLNPLLWHLDRNNPCPSTSTTQEVRQELCETYRLTDDEVERVIDTMSFA